VLNYGELAVSIMEMAMMMLSSSCGVVLLLSSDVIPTWRLLQLSPHGRYLTYLLSQSTSIIIICFMQIKCRFPHLTRRRRPLPIR
jgi:hypothetical protein